MRTAAAAGVGYTALSKASGRSVLDLAAEATRAAAADAGLPLSEAALVVSFSVLNDSVSSEAVAAARALARLRFVMDFQQGGQSPSFMMHRATMAVPQGY